MAMREQYTMPDLVEDDKCYHNLLPVTEKRKTGMATTNFKQLKYCHLFRTVKPLRRNIQ